MYIASSKKKGKVEICSKLIEDLFSEVSFVLSFDRFVNMSSFLPGLRRLSNSLLIGLWLLTSVASALSVVGSMKSTGKIDREGANICI